MKKLILTSFIAMIVLIPQFGQARSNVLLVCVSEDREKIEVRLTSSNEFLVSYFDANGQQEGEEYAYGHVTSESVDLRTTRTYAGETKEYVVLVGSSDFGSRHLVANHFGGVFACN